MVFGFEQSNDTAASRYRLLSIPRQPYIQRAWTLSELTIPSLFPRPGYTASRTFPTPFQSIGARVVTNLASKMLMTALPTNIHFFRLLVDPATMARIPDAEVRRKLESAMNERMQALERRIMQDIDRLSIRPVFHEALLHWAVTGSPLFYFDYEEECSRVYPLNMYAIERDSMGTILEIIIHERISKRALPEEALRVVVDNKLTPDPATDRLAYGTPARDEFDLYTVVQRRPSSRNVSREKAMFDTWQEISTRRVPRSDRPYKGAKLPWIPMRYSIVSGESYARSFAEQIYGSLVSIEGLSQILLEGAAALAKVIFLADETLGVNIQALGAANNGAIIPGRANAVTAVQANKAMDLKVAEEALVRLVTDLQSQAMIFEPRDSDRTTAEENRIRMAQMETALGGPLSLLDSDWVRPFLTLMLEHMKGTEEWPTFPDEFGIEQPLKREGIYPRLVTGLEALGRGQEYERAKEFFITIQQVFGPAGPLSAFDMHDLLSGLAASSGVDLAAYGLKSQDQIQQEQQSLQQRELLQNMAGPAAQVLGKTIDANSQQAAAPAA